jgi:creatinine amidohydrolase/Fe(II)-dependent formamide hydrolase-like protein
MAEARVPSPRNDTPPPSAFDYPIELDPALNGDAVSRFVTPAAHRSASGPDGSLGDATGATAGKGRAMVDAIAAALTVLIDEIRRAPVGETRADIPY